MVHFININTKNDIGKIKEVKELIENGNTVYLLVYWEECGPCKMVRPEWAKLIKKDLHEDVYIVDMNQEFLNNENNTFAKKETIVGFPTMRRITKNSSSDFSGSLPKVADLVEWIGEKKQQGGKKKEKPRKLSLKSTKSKKSKSTKSRSKKSKSTKKRE